MRHLKLKQIGSEVPAVPALPASSDAPHTLSVTVYGHPAPQGSKRLLAHGAVVDTNPGKLKPWRDDVRQATFRAMERTPSWERTYPAYLAHITFTMPRPRSHYLTHGLRTNAPDLCHTRPDLDKLLRSTLDALTAAGAYPDDSRLAQVWAAKYYTSTSSALGVLEQPGAWIVLAGVTP